MSTYVLVHGGNMSTDTWNKLARSNDYPSGGLLGAKYGTVLSHPSRHITTAFLRLH